MIQTAPREVLPTMNIAWLVKEAMNVVRNWFNWLANWLKSIGIPGMNFGCSNHTIIWL